MSATYINLFLLRFFRGSLLVRDLRLVMLSQFMLLGDLLGQIVDKICDTFLIVRVIQYIELLVF